MSVSQGKGSNLAAAKASGLMESIEGFHAEHIDLPLRVLSTDDLGFAHTGSQLFMTYLQNKEQLKKRYTKFSLQSLGVGDLL